MKQNSTKERSGLDPLTEISAFLGGIFFTALILLIERKEDLGDIVILNISPIVLIAVPLSFSMITFIFAGLCFATSCNAKTEYAYQKLEDVGYSFFIVGFISMFISLSIILFIVDLIVGVIGLIFIIGSFTYWMSQLKH
jgi:hypothetical protein